MNPRLMDLIDASGAIDGLHLFLPAPTCCRSCVEPSPSDKKIIETTKEPYLWIFRSDGSINDATYWNDEASGDTVGHIQHARLTSEQKIALHAELLKRWRFVEMPVNDDYTFEVGLWRGL